MDTIKKEINTLFAPVANSKGIANKLSVGAKSLADLASDFLTSSDFINRTIGDPNAYEGIAFLSQALGYDPVSLLGKDYAFIFDHVRRNVRSEFEYIDGSNMWPKFTYYGKERPTVRFADIDRDARDYFGKWEREMPTKNTYDHALGYGGIEYSYSETDQDFPTMHNVEGKDGIGYESQVRSFNFHNDSAPIDLVKKTNDMFNDGRLKTLVARFHSSDWDSKSQLDPTQTAISSKYGLSHGRNLLKKSTTYSDGYDNPYCRVWTYHHQYSKLKDAIRPLQENGIKVSNEDLLAYGWDAFRYVGGEWKKGEGTRLDKYGVLNKKNGLVNIAPNAKVNDYFDGKQDTRDKNSVKRCMFSIENLAWKDIARDESTFDVLGLSPEQKGPFGGRIMWFPPYDLSFSEDTRSEWQSNKFIGRGENIYTYSNTERTGRLQFTMVIDHPSIIDYWTGRKGNGNNGVQLSEGNSGGVDNQDNEENTLLRFFAGCDILSAEKQTYKIGIPEAVEEEKPKVVAPQPDSTAGDNQGTKCLYCALYYPNNYSGKNDSGSNFAVSYLMNGIGSGLYYDNISKGVQTLIADDKIMYGGQQVGGYEMRSGVGISILKDYPSTSGKSIVENGKIELFPLDATKNLSVTIGNTSYTLCKMIGKEALENAAWSTLDFSRHRLYYRVDSNTLQQTLHKQVNHIDTKSYQYNSIGYETGAAKIKITPNEQDTLVSFASMYVALMDLPSITSTLEGLYDTKQVEFIKDFKQKLERGDIKVKSVECKGNASKQNTSARSAANQKNLAENRALTLSKFITNWLHIQEPKVSVNEADEATRAEGTKDVNDPDFKAWRSAYIKIEYTEESVTNAQEQTTNLSTSGSVGTDTIGTNTEPLGKYESTSNEFEYGYSPNGMTQIISGLDAWKNVSGNTVFKANKAGSTQQAALVQSAVTEPKKEEEKVKVNQPRVESRDVPRYDNEGEFFEKLEMDAPFVHHLIRDKIRYFDPAFHSISPEGFQARLTFLQQCTRQGPTIGVSDGGHFANNLAFGRPPVCVLRIGDFYYTKIIIDSIGITYDTNQWDLNTEGIGVMPMFAKVSISFKFIGGSDLSGPIARLQNATSFNYYANTSVYDNRAEQVEYDAKGNVTRFKPYEYMHHIYDDKELAPEGLMGIKTVPMPPLKLKEPNLDLNTLETSNWMSLINGALPR